MVSLSSKLHYHTENTSFLKILDYFSGIRLLCKAKFIHMEIEMDN